MLDLGNDLYCFHCPFLSGTSLINRSITMSYFHLEECLVGSGLRQSVAGIGKINIMHLIKCQIGNFDIKR